MARIPEGLAHTTEGYLPEVAPSELRRIVIALQNAEGAEHDLTAQEESDIDTLPLLPGSILTIDFGDGHVKRSVILSPPRHKDPKVTDLEKLQVGKGFEPGEDLELDVRSSTGTKIAFKLWALGIVEVRGRKSGTKSRISRGE